MRHQNLIGNPPNIFVSLWLQPTIACFYNHGFCRRWHCYSFHLSVWMSKQPQTEQFVYQCTFKFLLRSCQEVLCPMADIFGPRWEFAKLDELGSDRSRTGSHTSLTPGAIQEEQYVGDGTNEPAPLLPHTVYRDAETITGQWHLSA